MDPISTLIDGLEEFDALANDFGGVFSNEWIDAELLSLLSLAIDSNHGNNIRGLLIEDKNSCIRSDDELLTDFNGAFTLITVKGISTFQKNFDDIELLNDLSWSDLYGVYNISAFADGNENVYIYFGDSENNAYIWGGSFCLGKCDESLYIEHLNDSKMALSELINDKNLLNLTKDSTPKIVNVAKITPTSSNEMLINTISNIIFDYYEFLERADENYKGNSEIIDDGSEALYCILFKLMGDTRTFETLCSEFLDWPTATEFKYSAQKGDYDSVLEMMRDHDCGMLENGAIMEISSKIIKDLEGYIPKLKDCIISGESAKDPEFLNKVFANLELNIATSINVIPLFFQLTIYDSYGGDANYFDKKIFSSGSYQELKSVLNDYWSDLIDCGFLIASEDNEYDLIHVESGTVVEGHLMAYKDESDAENEINAMPFQNSQLFGSESREITSGTCWDEISDRLGDEDDALEYWGLEDITQNPPEELKNSYDDEFFTVLFDVYKVAASRN